jgi:CheY-like chemotaxis protein
MHSSPKSFSILLADDSADDRLFLRYGLRDFPHLKIVAEVENGQEAIDYLSGTGKFCDRGTYPFPDLLVLDLKMPGLDGFGVLCWLQQQDFPHLKVMVHSGSFLKEDIAQAMELGAHAFHTKASSRTEQQQIVNTMEAVLQEAAEHTERMEPKL